VRKLTLNQWAVICTLHQCPHYQFAGDDKRIADRMLEAGLLEKKKDRIGGTFHVVTPEGERRYKGGHQ
jgi:DNA-binding MarR family transcriptional regulator